MATREGAPPGLGRTSLWIFVSLAAVSCALTMVFLGMRAVMGIGGFCARGGPFVIAHPCPQGTPLLLVGGIWGGLIFAGIYVWQGTSRQVPGFSSLLWSALFLSLGWNFLEFGIDPPGDGGLAWGWLVCAVVFAAMGGLPLRGAIGAVVKEFGGSSAGRPFGGALPPATIRAAASTMAAVRKMGRAGGGDASGEDGGNGDVVSALERLHALHRSGALDDQEYRAAKRRVIEGGRS
ncbi:MAG: hypothetical protein ACRDI0_12875 [Actinomycetota bacterium]